MDNIIGADWANQWNIPIAFSKKCKSIRKVECKIVGNKCSLKNDVLGVNDLFELEREFEKLVHDLDSMKIDGNKCLLENDVLEVNDLFELEHEFQKLFHDLGNMKIEDQMDHGVKTKHIYSRKF